MSTNEQAIIEAREKRERLHPNDIEEAGLDDIDQVITPQIIRKSDETGSDRMVVEPAYTETFRARTQNDDREHKTLCGQKYVEPIGEDEWNITIEGIVTESQLLKLIEMRPADNELKIVANPVGQKFNAVSFDQFTYELRDELNTGDFGNGEVPLAEFQLQTRDDQA